MFEYLPDKGDMEVVTFPKIVEKNEMKAITFDSNYWKSVDSIQDLEEVDKTINNVYTK